MKRPDLRRIASPEAIAETPAFAASVLLTLVIFGIDFLWGQAIRLHVLYIFPLSAALYYCERRWMHLGGLMMSIGCQAITLADDGLSPASYAIDMLTVAAAALLTFYLARMARVNFLSTQALTVTDPLTRLSNRRGFERLYDRERARQQRSGDLLALLVLDLDGFKALNDSRGHASGDAALQLMGDILRQTTRSADCVARIGGDEFAVLMALPRVGGERRLPEQLREEVGTRMAQAGFAITVSIGCVHFTRAPQTLRDALDQADTLMYAAKKAGRNRVMRNSVAACHAGPAPL